MKKIDEIVKLSLMGLALISIFAFFYFIATDIDHKNFGKMAVCLGFFWLFFLIFKAIPNDIKQNSINEMHRLELIKMYQSQLKNSGNFMTIVLTEAIRKLKEIPNVDAKKVEDWVVRLEKDYMNF